MLPPQMQVIVFVFAVPLYFNPINPDILIVKRYSALKITFSAFSLAAFSNVS